MGFLFEYHELSRFPSPHVLYTVYLLCRFPTDFECISLLCCVIKEYHQKMVRKTHVMKLQVVQEACVRGRTLKIFFSFSVLPHLHTPITLWFIGETSWCLLFSGSWWKSSCCSWSTFLQLCRYRQVLTDKSFSAVICVFVLCATYPLPNSTAELISSELSLV